MKYESKRYLIYKKDKLLCTVTLLPKFNIAIKQSSRKDAEKEVISIEKANKIIEAYKRHIESGNEQKIKLVEEGVEYDGQQIPFPNGKKKVKLSIKVKRGGENVQSS